MWAINLSKSENRKAEAKENSSNLRQIKLENDPIEECISVREKLGLIDSKIRTTDAKQLGIQIYRAEPHQKQKGQVFLDLTEEFEMDVKLKFQEEEEYSDPIKEILRTR